MQNLNQVTLLGNLTKDAEVKTTPQGVNVAQLSIATNKQWKDQNGQEQKKTEFHNIVAWKGLADVASRFCKKGLRVYIEGELQTRSWDGQDGKKNYKTEIVAKNIIMIDFPPKDDTKGVPEHEPEGSMSDQSTTTQEENIPL